MAETQTVINCFYKDINSEQSSFITSEDFIKYIVNDIVSRNLIIAFNFDNSRIKYNKQYGIIYDSKEIDIDDIIKEINDELKDIISINEIKEYNKVQNSIVKNMTQKNIADILKVELGTVLKYESGMNEPNIKSIYKISRILFKRNEKYLTKKQIDDS